MPRRHSAPRVIAAIGATAALAFALGACSGSDTGAAEPTPSVITAQASASAHNSTDTQFVQAMIVHHQGAIQMAELAAQGASSQEVRDLAAGISAAQGPEIELMTGWLDAWGESTESSMPGMDHDGMDMDGMTMDGLTQDEAMGDLDGLTGTDLDQRFLELMIAHHKGAITMAEQELAGGTNPDALELANKIVADQSAEITTMQNLLNNL